MARHEVGLAGVGPFDHQVLKADSARATTEETHTLLLHRQLSGENAWRVEAKPQEDLEIRGLAGTKSSILAGIRSSVAPATVSLMERHHL